MPEKENALIIQLQLICDPVPGCNSCIKVILEQGFLSNLGLCSKIMVIKINKVFHWMRQKCYLYNNIFI
jgi:hypothetical protein